MKAFLKNYRQAPRKVRLIANHLRGKNVAVALADLSFMPQKASKPLHKLLSSAVANARQQVSGIREDELIIKTITVDKGITYVRFMPRAFGRAAPIHKECAHVYIELAPKTAKAGKVAQSASASAKASADKAEVKEEKPKAKKAPAKKKTATKKTT
jgi:large subunit ribosomal protein L22